MSSCQRFVQNAWKKELCSNCFKSKDEHIPTTDNKTHYLATLKPQSSKLPPQSILKGVKIKQLESRKVNFSRHESEIIGVGGEDYSDDENDKDFLQENEGFEEDITDGEEEKELQRLTKSNTDFNSNPANLLGNDNLSDVKKPAYTPLMLGKPVKDAHGKKQTLFVSVQPFGTGNEANSIAINRKTHFRSILHASSDLSKIKEINPVIINSSVDKSICAPFRITDVDDVKISYEKTCSYLSNSECSNPVELTLLNGNENDVLKPIEEEQFKIKESSEKTETVETFETETVKTDSYFTLSMEEQSQIMKTSSTAKSFHKIETSHSPLEIESVKFEFGNIMLHENVNESSKEKKLIEETNIINISNNVCGKKIATNNHLNTKAYEILNRKSLSKLKSVNCACNDCIVTQGDVELEHSESVLCLLETCNMQVKAQCSEKEMNCANFVITNLDKEVPNTVNSQIKDEPFHIMKIMDPLAESREMAGEPDGRADSDDLDEPLLGLLSSPLQTPTCEPHPQPSFLHNLTKDKPRIPLKPKLVDSPPVKEEVGKCEEPKEIRTPSPTNCNLLSSTEFNGKSIKRQAPKPPLLPNDDGLGVFVKNSGNQGNMDSPVVRERIKRVQRERAASCSPLPSDSSSNGSGHQTPEPLSSMHSVYVSHETLSYDKNATAGDKKRGNKMRSTIRKFLRLGSRSDHVNDELLTSPLPPVRPRPEIIHPLDINKSGVEVVRGSGSHIISERASFYSPSSPRPVSSSTARPNKPPPPPRSQSLDLILDTRPARPPPPRVQGTADQRQTYAKTDSVYANIGEARSSIAPVKPHRTASILDSFHKEGGSSNTGNFSHDSEPQVVKDNDNVYEYLAPECDLSRERSSLPYCGSETESDIYYPYTFGNNQELLEDDSDTPVINKNRLYVHKGSNVIHKTLEENYNAIVTANYEVLSQLLEQVHQTPLLSPSLRALKATTSLQWSDFDVSEDSSSVLIGGRVFLNAHWNQVPVTLCLTLGQSRLPNTFSPLIQFFDLVASKYLNSDKTELVQVSIAVLIRQQVFSLGLYCSILKDSVEAERESVLIMVQVINNLKCLQARGTEDTHLTQFIVSREEKDFNSKVYHLPQENEKKNSAGMSLCQCAVTVVAKLPLPKTLSTVLHTLLIQEKATSLSQCKAILELWLWGPTHATITSDVQVCLQYWLDFERATVLNSLAVNHQNQMSVSEYCRLSFLVGTNVKIMTEALAHLDSKCTSNNMVKTG